MSERDEFEHEFASTAERDEFIDRVFPERKAAGSPPGWFDLPSPGAKGSKTSGFERSSGGGNIGVFIRTVTFYGAAAERARAALR